MKFISSLCAAFILAATAYATTPETPHKLVADTSAHVLNMVKTERAHGKVNLDKLAQNLLTILEPIVDFDGIAKAVMGKHFAAATPAQRAAFIPVFKNTLAHLYAKTLVKFEIGKIDVQPTPLDTPFNGKVTMLVTAADGTTYTIIYTLRQDDKKQWRVRNVTLDGINLGLTYRNQFDSAMTQDGNNIDQVIPNWSAAMDTPQ